MEAEKILKNEKRKQIYDTILDHPGLYLMEIKRKLSIPKTTLKYHIRFLEKHEMIIQEKCKYYLRYFASNKIANGDKKLLNLFRQEIPRRMILTVYLYIICNEMDIVHELDKDQSTISYHLKKLIEEEIIIAAPYNNGEIYRHQGGYIQRNRVSNETFYRLKDAKEIYNFLIKYHKILEDKEIVNYLLSMSRYIIKNGKRRNIIKYKHERIEKAINIIFDVFPHPYYI